MGEVRVGDRLFDEGGRPCRVTFATEVQVGRPCYVVRFDDGSEVVADADHRWLTWDKRYRKAMGRAVHPRSAPGTRTTEEIRSTLMANARERNHSIPLAAPLDLPVAPLPVDPYVLGVWLGDGSSAKGAVTVGDTDANELLGMLAASGVALSGKPCRKPGAFCATYPLGGKPAKRDAVTGAMMANGSLHSALRTLGVLKNKHVPAAYLRGSIEQRAALLAGLLDTDGFIAPGGNVEFTSTKEVLADAVVELAVSLGHKPVKAEGVATIYGRIVGPKWRVKWTPRTQVFRLRRKAERVRCETAQRNRTTHRYIVAVDPVPSEPVRCLAVDSRSHLYLAGLGMVPTHNTATGAGWVHERAEQEPGRWMAFVAKTPADARDYMIEGPAGVLRNPPLWCLDAPNGPWPKYEPSKRRITWPNGSWATVFSSEEPDGLRGFSGDTAWLDEYAKYKNCREVWENLQFGMREVSADRPRIFISTTPRPVPILSEIEEQPTTVVVTGSSYENRANLAPEWFTQTLAAYEGTRLGRQEIHGELLDDVEGLVYSSFSKAPFPAGNVDASVVDTGAEIFVGQDFNVNPMASVIGVKVADELHILDALEIQTSNTEEVAGELRRRYPGRKIVICPDPSGRARHSSSPVGMTDFTILQRAGFDVRAPKAAPLVVDRVNNTQAMLLQGTRRRIRIHPRAKALIRALGGLTYKEGTSIRDKASGLDHILDANDYLCWEEFRVLRPAAPTIRFSHVRI